MTAFHRESSIGERIQSARKQRGYRSTRELADAIHGGNVTEAILQNIEAGRKTDLSVSQLLNIALALRVAPAFLLAPLGRPADPLDLPNLSDAFSGMTAVEFESWFSGSVSGSYRWTSSDESNERHELESLRELIGLLNERRRLAAVKEIEDEALNELEDGTHSARSSFEARIEAVTESISRLRRYLLASGWDAP